MTKLLLTIIILSLVTDAPAQRKADRSKVNRAKRRAQAARTHPPAIKAFESARREICLPCPPSGSPGVPRACLATGTVTLLLVYATDPDGGELTYKYTTTGGEIFGNGPNAIWDFKGATPGTYSVTVTAEDKRGRAASKSLSIEVVPGCSEPSCNVLIIDCLDQVEEGQTAIFTARVSGGDPTVKPTFNWTVSAGKIIKGQGTDRIEVETTGLGGQALKATLEVQGYPPECSNVASCETIVNRKTQ